MCIPMGGGGGGDGGAAANEAARQAKIQTGYDTINNTFSGFDDNFYNKISSDYSAYAKPQLDDQYATAVKGLTYNLARAGQLNSSTRGTEFAQLQKQYNLQQTNIADTGNTYANNARTSVDQSKQSLDTLNNNTADPNVVANQAASNVAALQMAPQFSPLAPLFTNVGTDIATGMQIQNLQNNRLFNNNAVGNSISGNGSGRSFQ